MAAMADHETNAAFCFSSMLFTDEQSFQPLIFYIRPSATRARLKQLIESGGGIVTSRIDLSQGNVIRILADGDEHSSPDDYLPLYIDDCIAANSLLDKSEYRVRTKDQSSPMSEVTVAVSIKGRSYYTATEDNAILEYIAKHPYQYGGNKIWRKMEVMKITSHSWQSMRDHFRKKLERRLHKYTKKRQENLMMKKKKDSDIEVQQSSGDDDDGTKAKETQHKEIEDEASDASSFDLDLFQAADIQNTNSDGGNYDGIDNGLISSPRTTRTSSNDKQSKQVVSPIMHAVGLSRLRSEGTCDIPTNSANTHSNKTRSKSGGKQIQDEIEINKAIDAEDTDDAVQETEGVDDGATETDTEDKITNRNTESRRSSDEMIVVRLSSRKNRKTPVKKQNKHLLNNKSPLERSRRGMEMVSDSSGSDNGTSDVLPMKRTRHLPASASSVPDHALDTHAEEDSEHYSKIIEELCTKYRQTKLKILTALYVHSGDLTRTEEYLHNAFKSKGLLWSNSRDKLLVTSSSKKKMSIKYSKAAVDQRLEWLKS